MSTRILSCNGHIAPPHDLAPWGTSCTGAAFHSPDSAAPFERHVRRGGNQLTTESCVAWSYAGAVWALLGYLGIPQEWMSVLDLYYRARAITAGGDRTRIWDGGCRPDDAARAARFGWCPDRFYQFFPSMKDEEPPWDVLVVVSQKDWLQPRRIVATGNDRSNSIRAALGAPYPHARPVLRGQSVDQPYLDWVPGTRPWVLSSRIKGNHMEAALSYTPQGLAHVSSWGDSFDRVVSWDQVEAEETASDWIVDIDTAALENLINKVIVCGISRSR